MPKNTGRGSRTWSHRPHSIGVFHHAKSQGGSFKGVRRPSLWCRIGLHRWQPNKQCADCGDWDE